VHAFTHILNVHTYTQTTDGKMTKLKQYAGTGSNLRKLILCIKIRKYELHNVILIKLSNKKYKCIF
jgi:hypothetical protein